MPNALLKLLVNTSHFTVEKYPRVQKNGKRDLRGEGNKATADERQTGRLQQTSTSQQAVETPVEKETTLQMRSTNQREKLAVETPEGKN